MPSLIAIKYVAALMAVVALFVHSTAHAGSASSVGRVGVDVDQSGPSASVDKLLVRALAGPLAQRGLQLEIRDNQGLPDRSIAQLQRWQTASSVSLIVGGQASAISRLEITETSRPRPAMVTLWAEEEGNQSLLSQGLLPGVTEEFSYALELLHREVPRASVFSVMSLDALGRGCQQALVESLPDLAGLRLAATAWAAWHQPDWRPILAQAPADAQVWLVCLRTHHLRPFIAALSRLPSAQQPTALIVPFASGLTAVVAGEARALMTSAPIRPTARRSVGVDRPPAVFMTCPVRPCQPKVLTAALSQAIDAVLSDQALLLRQNQLAVIQSGFVRLEWRP
jgi:hypothetical protein